MKVSFIIPLFNRLELTRECLASLHATLPAGLAHEILLLDDGSTDGTRDWLRSGGGGPNSRALLNDRNLGYAGTNNRGAAEATGEILALLNSDLVLTRGWLEPLLAAFDADPRTGLAGNVQRAVATGRVDHAGIAIDVKCKPVHVAATPRRWFGGRREVPALTGACLFVRRDLFLRLGGFDEGFRNGGEDVDLCFRARAAGFASVVCFASVIGHHVSASPGRKRHDEANSRRLAHRWGDELVRLSLAAWCRNYFARHWSEPRDYDPHTLRSAAAFLLGLRRSPPDGSVAEQRAALAVEEARWLELLGPAAPVEFASSLAPRPSPG